MKDYERNFFSTGDNSSDACPYLFSARGKIMSVLIKGMEMPDRCFSCQMCYKGAETLCAISHGAYIEYRDLDESIAIDHRPDWCPLVHVPPHGRLIDADELLAIVKRAMEDDDMYEDDYRDVRDWLAVAPTVISGLRQECSDG